MWYVCVFKFFSEITGPTETKLHVEPPWDKGGKFIQMIQVICCSSFQYCQPFTSWKFTTNLARQCRAFTKALKIEKLKAPPFPGPKGTGDTNDWCINRHQITHHQEKSLLAGVGKGFDMKVPWSGTRKIRNTEISFTVLEFFISSWF